MSQEPMSLVVGDLLIKADGGFAEVIGIEYVRNSTAKNPPVFGYRLNIAEPGKPYRPDALIKVTDLPGFLSSWHLKSDAPAEEPADLTATATLIADLRDKLAKAEARANLVEAERDGQVVMMSMIGKDLGLSGTLGKEYGTAQMMQSVDELRHVYNKATVDLKIAELRIIDLTEQLAEARAHNAASRIATPAADLTTVPVREFKIIWETSEADLCRMEKDGWQIQHMQFGGEFNSELHIVYYRITTPTAPQPRKAVTAVGPTVTYIPPDKVATLRPTQRAQRDLEEVLAVGRETFEAALRNSPIHAPRPLLVASGNQS